MSKRSQKQEKPTSSYMIGDRTAADTYWDGNNYVTRYNPTESEKQAMSYLESSIPAAYQDALSGGNSAEYAQNWYNNQVNQLNQNLNPQLTALKDNLITGGQVGSNITWNKLKPITDSYTEALAELSANKDTMALDYRNSLLGWADSLQNSMNGYYNLGSQMSGLATTNQQNAANQNLDYAQYNSSITNPYSPLFTALGSVAGTAIGSRFGSYGAQLGSSLGGMLGSSLSRNSG